MAAGWNVDEVSVAGSASGHRCGSPPGEPHLVHDDPRQAALCAVGGGASTADAGSRVRATGVSSAQLVPAWAPLA